MEVSHSHTVSFESREPPEIRSEEISYLAEIGGGCFGRVHKGVCRGKEVAVKKLFKQDLGEKTLLSFKKEVDVCSRILHPNVVLFMGACTEPGNMCIVTELMPKGNIEELIKNPKVDLTLYTRMKMAKDAALGMNWLHCSDPQVIHRDMKPSNLLLDENLLVKVSDFGLSDVKPIGEMKQDSDAIPGTPLWMAPEIMLGKPFNEKSDVYSFGLVLWSMLTRSDPFQNFRSFPVFRDAVSRNVRPQVPPCLPSLRELIEGCWDNESPNRPSFATIINKLDLIMIDAAISDEVGNAVWKSNFTGKTHVSFESFVLAFTPHFGLSSCEEEEFLCLKETFVDTNLTSKLTSSIEEDHGYVSLEKFGQMLSYYGPLEPKKTVSRIVSIMKRDDFFGTISTMDSEKRLQKEKKKGYLIRLSTTRPGMFVVSRAIDKVINHQRVEYSPGKGYLVTINDKKELFKDWSTIVKRLKLEHPCPGRPYDYIFVKKAKVTMGYMDDDD